MRIAVKYCGGCNPVIERTRVVEEIESQLREKKPDWKLAPISAGNFDLLLLVNGCSVACTEEQFKDDGFPVLRIAGELLEGIKTPEQELPGKCVELILQQLTQNEKERVK